MAGSSLKRIVLVRSVPFKLNDNFFLTSSTLSSTFNKGRLIERKWCARNLQDNHDNTYLYVIGGWNKEYTGEVHRIGVDAAAGALLGTDWETFTPMREPRSDQVGNSGYVL